MVKEKKRVKAKKRNNIHVSEKKQSILERNARKQMQIDNAYDIVHC